MKNNNYSIENVENNGDCFFAVLREAFIGIPLVVEVKELRQILVDHMEDKTFRVRMDRFKMFKNAVTKAKIAKSEINKTYKKKKKDLLKIFNDKKKASQSEGVSDQDKKKFIAEALAAKNEWSAERKRLTGIEKKKTEEVKIAEADLLEYNMMKDVSTIEQFKNKIKTTEYWADEWAIKKLEGLLNIKMIIFSKEKFEGGELEGVLHCGGEIAKHVLDKGVFKPQYYIMAVHTGNHYKLVKYKDRRIYKFNEIPNDVKDLIVSKCLETSRNSEWNFIPKFRVLSTPLDSDKKEGAKKTKTQDEEEPESKKTESTSTDLYSEDVVFQFYSRSADKPKPGKGSGEKIPDDRVSEFNELVLQENKGWRKVLSNFYIAQFQLDGKQWNSVEHYYQGSKFKNENPDYYKQFSLDSAESKINKDPILAKKSGEKNSKVKIDADFFPNRASKEMKKAQMEKYRTNENARRILLLTKDAKLVHYAGRGKEPIVFTETMEIREQLKEK